MKIVYKRCVRQCHPDLYPDDAVKYARFIEVRQAYEMLCDPNHKAWHVSSASYQRASPRPAPTPRASHATCVRAYNQTIARLGRAQDAAVQRSNRVIAAANDRHARATRVANDQLQREKRLAEEAYRRATARAEQSYNADITRIVRQHADETSSARRAYDAEVANLHRELLRAEAELKRQTS